MKHVAIIVNPDTKSFEVVLKWPAFNPIGLRLEKGLKMPSTRATGIMSMDYALIAAKEYDDWMEAQENGQRTKTAVDKKPQHDHYAANKDFVLKSEEKKPESPKLLPPQPKPEPPPKKVFIPEPFDA